MAAPAPNPDVGRLDEHDDGDTRGSESTHEIATKMSALSVSASASASTSTQAEPKTPESPKPTMQDAGEASTSPPNITYVATSGKRYPVPSVISAIEKEIVAAGVARLDMFEGLHPEYVLFVGPTAMERAQEIMNKEAQKSHESRKIWDDIFKQGRNVTNKNLFEHDIFSQDAWKKLYELLIENGMYPPEVLRETDEETRQTLELWEEAQNQRCEEYRKESEELQAEWQRRVDAGAAPILQLVGLPPRDGEDDSEEGA